MFQHDICFLTDLLENMYFFSFGTKKRNCEKCKLKIIQIITITDTESSCNVKINSLVPYCKQASRHSIFLSSAKWQSHMKPTTTKQQKIL